MGKTEGSPIRLGRDFGRLNSWKNPLAKVVDFEPLGALSGPGAPDPDLLGFVLGLSDQDGMESCDTCMRTEPILQT